MISTLIEIAVVIGVIYVIMDRRKTGNVTIRDLTLVGGLAIINTLTLIAHRLFGF